MIAPLNKTDVKIQKNTGEIERVKQHLKTKQITAETLTLTEGAPASPVKNRIYKDTTIKAWGTWVTDGTLQDSFNISSVARDGVGIWTVNWDIDFANDDYAITATGNNALIYQYTIATGSCNIRALDNDFSGNMRDCTYVSIIAVGSQ